MVLNLLRLEEEQKTSLLILSEYAFNNIYA